MTKIFFHICDTSISTYQLDQNIHAHHQNHNFYVFYLTKIFVRIPDIAISTYLLHRDILSHPRQIHFFVSTRPQYSIGSLTPPILCTYSTRIFYCILDNSISLYLLDRNIPLHPRHLLFFVSTRPDYSIASSTTSFLCIYSTRIFHCILDTSISLYLLDRSILLHPQQLHFFVSTRPEYSIASLTPPFVRTYSTTIFYCIRDTSISTYLLDHNILSYP